ncbi:MAG TPA: PAS domain S-box protein [Clostridia bacterium]|nr:PAS domain S-box protein [Clostridia bacterium]
MKITLEGKENKLLIKTLSCMGDGVIVTDIKGNIFYMNTVAEELTGWKFDIARRKDFSDVFNIVDADTCESLESPIDRVIRAKTSIGLIKGSVLITNDGTSRYISASCSPIKDANHLITGVVIVFRDISRLSRIEQELERERNNFKVAFETAPIGMLILDKNARIKLANRYFLNMVGKKSVDIIDRSLWEGIGCVEKPKGKCEISRAISKAVNEDVSIIDSVVQRKVMFNNKQKCAWFKFSTTPITVAGEKQMLFAIEDITTRKEYEDVLKRYQVIFENARDIIYFVDTDGRIVWANESSLRAYGYSREEMLSLTIYDLGEDSQVVKKQMKTVRGKGLFYESLHTRKDGTTFPTEISVKGVYMGGEQILTSIVRDVTERKNAEQELKAAKEEAEKASKSKSEFLANMSHEIRTPLNGMLGMIDLTLLTELNKEQKENLLTAKHCADSLLNIINDILDFSKMEAGKLVIKDENFNIKELIENIARTHAHHAKKKKLDLSYSFSASIPTYLWGDPNRLQQILDNLINNAIKFTENGGVSVSVEEDIRTDDNIGLKFVVTDTGIGISCKDKDRLFEVFSQLDGSYTKKHGGTGLGLAISKRLVETMGGEMWVESEKDKGSIFSFTLKFKKGNEPAEKQENIIAPVKSINPQKILLAEDDKVNQTVLTRMLKEKGHSVDIANNGVEAISMYKRKRYDVILMDIQLPVMDGIEATNQIRTIETESMGNRIPIIALTAFALRGDREKFLSNGIDEYISKPVQMEELFHVIDTVSGAKGRPRPLFKGVPKIDGDGNIIFATETGKRSGEELMSVICQIEDKIKLLENTLEYDDLMEIEAIAHGIKNLSNKIDAEQLKNAAFKIELSTRRGNLSQTIENIANMMDNFDIYKKSVL